MQFALFALNDCSDVGIKSIRLILMNGLSAVFGSNNYVIIRLDVAHNLFV